MALLETDVEIVHSTEDGYRLDDLTGARFRAYVDSNAREAEYTRYLPKIMLSFDEEHRTTLVTVTSRDKTHEAIAVFSAEMWTVTGTDGETITEGEYYTGYRTEVMRALLIEVGVPLKAEPRGLFGRLFSRS